MATFTNLKIAGAGGHTLTFTSGALTPATSNAVTVTQVAAALVVTQQPAGAVSGVAFTTQPVIEIRDNAGLVVTTGTGSTEVVTAAIATGTGTLGGTLTATAVNGVATFATLQLTGSGAHTPAVHDHDPGAECDVKQRHHRRGTGDPTGDHDATGGCGEWGGLHHATGDRDSRRGWRATTSTATVTAALASGLGTLSGTLTATAVNGVATFTNLKIAGPGAHTLTFTSGALTPATSNAVTVTQVAAALVVTQQPAGAVSGVAFTTQPVIEIRDNAGLVVTTGASATEVVTAAIATGTGTLGGTLTATAVNGVATFATLQLTGSGAHTLQFTTTTPALSVTSSSVTIGAGPATQLAITTQPTGAVSGVAFTTQPVIEIHDAGGALTTSTATVTAALASGLGALSGTLTATAVNGVATFTNLKIAGPGAHTLTFTSGALTPATSNAVTVTQVAAALVVTQQPAGAVSGVAFTTQPVIEIRDNAGLVVTTGTGSTEVVTAAIATGTGTLGGTLTATAVNGVATFTTLQLTGSGAHTLQFTTTTPALSVTSSSVNVIGAPSQLAITTQPAGAVSGVAFTTQPVIEIRDASGNLTSSAAAVTASIAGGSGALSGTVTVSAVNGVATFTDLQIAGFGAHTLTFTSGALNQATSSSFAVTQVATSLTIQTQPVGAVSGAPLATQPVVQIRDNAGLVITTGAGATLAVTVSIATGPGALTGTTTVNAVNGVATFTNLVITGDGDHTLKLETTTPALSIISGTVTVTP
ncbi:MAG: hypothetical protein IPP90_07775 [Gemmatimonadaceae bacterium]|nr:hypothetical protein [Gemmatimonadaceae bacterium]